ncbi:hypothetical protein CcaverHIS002_0402760 [Cutaneotrichosporon cavernicola]|nr:hypothetical protein CcaverHIS002_0402760 [Cutaneotrichosporon cavernicola]
MTEAFFVLPNSSSPPPYSPLLALPDAVLARIDDFLDLTDSDALRCTCTHMHALLSPPPTPAESLLFEQPPSYEARVRLLFWGANWHDGMAQVEDVTTKFANAGRVNQVSATDILDMAPSPSLSGMRFRYNSSTSDREMASWGDDPYGQKASRKRFNQQIALQLPISLHRLPSEIDAARRWHDIALDKHGRVWERGLAEGEHWAQHTDRLLANVVHVVGTKSRAAVTATGRIVAWRIHDANEPVSILPRLPQRSMPRPERTNWIEWYPTQGKADPADDRTLKLVCGRCFVVAMRDNGEIWLATRQNRHEWHWHSVARVLHPTQVELTAADHSFAIYRTASDSAAGTPTPTAWVVLASRSGNSTAWSVSSLDIPPVAQLSLHDAQGMNHGVARTRSEVFVWRTRRDTGQVSAKRLEMPFIGRGLRLMPVEVCAAGCLAVEVADDSIDEPVLLGLRRFFSPGSGGRKGRGRVW